MTATPIQQPIASPENRAARVFFDRSIALLDEVSKQPSLISGVLEATSAWTKGDRQTLRTDLDALQGRSDKVNEELGRCVDAVAKGTRGALGPGLMKRVETLRAEQDQLVIGREKSGRIWWRVMPRPMARIGCRTPWSDSL